MLAVLLVSVLALPPAQAPASATFGWGEVYELPAGTVVPKDLYVIASEVTIDGTVEGDLAVVARRVWLSGTVRGNTNIVAARIEITGRTFGIVRTVGAAQIVPPSPLPARHSPPAPALPAPGAPLPTPTALPARPATTGPAHYPVFRVRAGRVSGRGAGAAAGTAPGPARPGQAGGRRWQSSGQLLLGFAVLSALLLWRVPGTLLKPAGAIAAHPWRSLLIGLLAAQFSLIVPLATGALVLAMGVFWGWFPAVLLAAALLAGFGLLWFLSPLVTGVWLGRRLGPLLGRGTDGLPVLVGGVLLLVVIGQLPRFGWLVYLVSFLLALGGMIGLAATRSARMPVPGPAPAPGPPATPDPLPAGAPRRSPAPRCPPIPCRPSALGRPPGLPGPPGLPPSLAPAAEPLPVVPAPAPRPHRHQGPPDPRPQTDRPPAWPRRRPAPGGGPGRRRTAGPRSGTRLRAASVRRPRSGARGGRRPVRR